jgi:geranylgeranyl diphosphate synthase type I
MSSPLDVADLRKRVDAALTDFLAGQSGALEAVDPDLAPIHQEAAAFLLEGGKRLRPAFAYWGWVGAHGSSGPDGAGVADDVGVDEVIAAASALELLHACALVHDDVMDGSDTRRGRRSVHRHFAITHRDNGWDGDPDAFGRAVAILLGDLFLVWSDALLAGSGLPPDALARVRPVWDEMRVELMAGEYLDVLTKAAGTDAGGQLTERDIDRALQVARFKSGKYTIERPLQLGAAIAFAGPEITAAYSAYGLPLGEAFQLRDDVLGVFGDPAETGKPTGDDLRDGKRTALIAHAAVRASAAQASVIEKGFGNPSLDADGVAELQEIIVATGALAVVEDGITRRTEESIAALQSAPLVPAAAEVLTSLAAAATRRRA